MRQRRPQYKNRWKILAYLNDPTVRLLPSELKILTGLSRPTVFNVLIFLQEQGTLVKYGKRYGRHGFGISCSKKRKPKKPLGERGVKVYNRLLNEKKIGEGQEYMKNIFEAYGRNTDYYDEFIKRVKPFKKTKVSKQDYRGFKHGAPLKRYNKDWEKEQEFILKQLQKQNTKGTANE